MGSVVKVPTFITISSESMGIDPNLAFYLVAIINGSSGFARCFAGWLADRTGAQQSNMCRSFHNNLGMYVYRRCQPRGSHVDLRSHNDIHLAIRTHRSRAHRRRDFVRVRPHVRSSPLTRLEPFSFLFMPSSNRQAVGTYVSCFVIPVFSLGSTGDIGRRTGMVLTFAAIGGLAGTPIAGAINKATGGYKAVGYYAGMPPCAAFFGG